MSLLLNHRGLPEPSPEIQRRLKEVHSGLSLKFVESIQKWAVMKEWEKDDRRWEIVQSGGINPADARDTVGYLPIDCNPDDAPAYIEPKMRTHNNASIRGLVERMDVYNGKSLDSQVDKLIGEVMDGGDPSKDKTEVKVSVTVDKPAKKVAKKKVTKKSKYLDS